MDDTTTMTPRHRSSLLTPIAPQADSAHVSGFHPAGGTLSRYNHQREGIIFSDAECASLSSGFCCCATDTNDAKDAGGTTPPPQSYDLSAMFGSLHGIAEHVLFALERKLELVVVPPATRDTNQVHEDDAATVSSSLADSVLASNGDQPKQTAPKNTRGWFQRNLGTYHKHKHCNFHNRHNNFKHCHRFLPLFLTYGSPIVFPFFNKMFPKVPRPRPVNGT